MKKDKFVKILSKFFIIEFLCFLVSLSFVDLILSSELFMEKALEYYFLINISLIVIFVILLKILKGDKESIPVFKNEDYGLYKITNNTLNLNFIQKQEHFEYSYLRDKDLQIQILNQINNYYNCHEFKDNLEKFIIEYLCKLNYAILNNKIIILKNMETERLYSKHCEQSNFKNYDIKAYKYLQVTTTFIVGFQHYDDCDYIYVKVCLSNYEDNLEILTTLYFEVIMNNKNEIDNEKNTSNCENCGASDGLNALGFCKYCNEYSEIFNKENIYSVNEVLYWDIYMKGIS